MRQADGVRADAAMTAAREEIKYMIPTRRLEDFTAALDASLASHRFLGEGCNRLPAPRHFVTTIYFDTPEHSYYQEACARPMSNLKVRAKDYYDVHPQLAEVATSREQMVRCGPYLWLEIKQRDGSRTLKKRARLTRAEAREFLTREEARPSLLEADPELGEFWGHATRTLQPSCLVNYRRRSWQDELGTLRVTMDVELAYYAPPSVWPEAGIQLTRDALGEPAGRDGFALVEVKLRGGLPGWLVEALERGGALPISFSKFVRASQVVHGRL